MSAIWIQRAENATVAVAILVAVIVMGLPWWVLLAAFLLFDLSALGYLRSARVGALFYNAVHNYAPAALLVVIYCGFLVFGHDLTWIVLLAACWGFHVAVDRALGYGLKLQSFADTHLGRVGRKRQLAGNG